MGTAGVLDLLLLGGGDEAVAFAHFEVLFAAQDADEAAADGTLHVAWHIVIHITEAALHHGFAFGTKHRAIFIAVIRITRVDTTGNHTRWVGILPHQPTETLLAEGAMIQKTYYVVIYLVAEDFFLCLYHIILFHGCKGTHVRRSRR